VDLDVAGSNPVTRPNYFRYSILNSRLEHELPGAPGPANWVARAAQEIEAVSDERADLILNTLRAIRGKQDQHDQKFDEVITRLGALGRDFAGMKLEFAGVHVRLDNIGRRLDRVERRLELVDEPAS
jgi:hypothetical protein